MKFMVIPERKDLVIPVFKSAENGKDVNSGELKNKIMEFLGTEVTDRGFVHFNFDCEGKLYYHEVKNITLEQYCMKPVFLLLLIWVMWILPRICWKVKRCICAPTKCV